MRRKKTHTPGLHHALSGLQLVRVRHPLWADILPLVPTMFLLDVIPSHPRRDGSIDQTPFFPKEVRTLGVLRERAQRGLKLLERGCLLWRLLRLEQPLERRNNGLADVVDPEARLRAGEGVGGEEVRLVGGESVFEEFTDDEGFVEWLVLVLDRRDEPLRVDGCKEVSYR